MCIRDRGFKFATQGPPNVPLWASSPCHGDGKNGGQMIDLGHRWVECLGSADTKLSLSAQSIGAAT
eukprot:2903729-Alexandrium_andersonii.AAC.1